MTVALQIIGSFFVPYTWNILIGQMLSRKSYQKLSESQLYHEIEITENGIIYGASKEKIPWSDFKKWKESDESILMYLDTRRFLIIPRRIDGTVLSISKLKGYLGENIGKAA